MNQWIDGRRYRSASNVVAATLAKIWVGDRCERPGVGSAETSLPSENQSFI